MIKDKTPQAEFHIYGGGDQIDSLRSLIGELGLEKRVFLHGVVPAAEISSIIENADLGIVPKRKNLFGNEAFSTKILEFMCLGVPAIIPDTMIDRYYFNDSIVRFFTANDEKSLADAMLLLIENAELRKTLVRNASEFVEQYTWKANECVYLDLVDSLLLGRG